MLRLCRANLRKAVFTYTEAVNTNTAGHGTVFGERYLYGVWPFVPLLPEGHEGLMDVRYAPFPHTMHCDVSFFYLRGCTICFFPNILFREFHHFSITK